MAQPKQRQQPSEQSLVGSAPLLPLLPEQQYVKNKGKPRRRVCKESTEEKHPTRHKLNHAKPRDKEILEEEEIFNLLEAFRKYFPEPPSNLRAQEIIESRSGRFFTEKEQWELWENVLKPWSQKWYSKKEAFFRIARARFLNTPSSQFITKELAEEWAKSFFQVGEKMVAQ